MFKIYDLSVVYMVMGYVWLNLDQFHIGSSYINCVKTF